MIEFLTAIPFARMKGYLYACLPRLTPKKILNILKAEIEFTFKHRFCSSLPYHMICELTNFCQLKCPLCATGQGKHQYPTGKMAFSTFKKLIDETGDYQLFIQFACWGEPFLHAEASKFFQYAHQKNIATLASTNFSYPVSSKKMVDLVKSGLDILVVSLDGITPKVYSRYRVQGDFTQVIRNIRLLARTKKKLHSRTPYIQWQFLVSKYNEHQISRLPAYASKLKVDSLVLIPMIVLFGQSKDHQPKLDDWIPKDKKYQPNKYSLVSNKSGNLKIGKCWWPWRDFVLHHDGKISPCCYNNDQSLTFGNVLKDDFHQIWNNQKYISARSLFHKGRGTVKTICHQCEIMTKKPVPYPTPRLDDSADFPS